MEVLLKQRLKNEPLNVKYFGIVGALAIATGFLSGGIQHYLDNPIYAGYLLAIGLVVAYVAFGQKYHYGTSMKGLVIALAIGMVIIIFSNTVLHEAIPHEVGAGHQH